MTDRDQFPQSPVNPAELRAKVTIAQVAINAVADSLDRPLTEDLARLHRAERRYWLTRCFWIVLAAVGLTVAVTWLVLS